MVQIYNGVPVVGNADVENAINTSNNLNLKYNDVQITG